MAVRYIGADKIGKYEHVAVEFVGQYIPEGVKEGWRRLEGRVMEAWKGGKEAVKEHSPEGYAMVAEGMEVAMPPGAGAEGGFGQGVKEADEMNQSDNASM